MRASSPYPLGSALALIVILAIAAAAQDAAPAASMQDEAVTILEPGPGSATGSQEIIILGSGQPATTTGANGILMIDGPSSSTSDIGVGVLPGQPGSSTTALEIIILPEGDEPQPASNTAAIDPELVLPANGPPTAYVGTDKETYTIGEQVLIVVFGLEPFDIEVEVAGQMMSEQGVTVFERPIGITAPGDYTFTARLSNEFGERAYTKNFTMHRQVNQDISLTTNMSVVEASRPIEVALTVDEDATSAVYVIEPEGTVLAIEEEYKGNLVFAYVPVAAGNYTVVAEIGAPHGTDLYTGFEVERASFDEGQFGLELQEGSSLNEPKEIIMSAAEDAFSKVFVLEPQGNVHVISEGHLGGLVFTYVPAEAGNYTVLVEIGPPYQTELFAGFTIDASPAPPMSLTVNSTSIRPNEAVAIILDIPGDVKANLVVLEPEGVATVLDEGFTGGATFNYVPMTDGDYTVVAEILPPYETELFAGFEVSGKAVASPIALILDETDAAVGDTVRADLDVPAEVVSTVYVTEPSGATHLIEEGFRGPVSFNFVPDAVGDYTVVAEVGAPYHDVLYARLVATPKEGGLEALGIAVTAFPKTASTYETVDIILTVPYDATSSVLVITPDAQTHTLIEWQTGPQSLGYVPETEGNYTVKADVGAPYDLELLEGFVVKPTDVRMVPPTQYAAEVGKPVRWRRLVRLAQGESLADIMPDSSGNLKIRMAEGHMPASPDPRAISKQGEWRSFPTVTALENDVTEDILYEVEYETPAPIKRERPLSARKKRVIISSPEKLHYTNVLVSTMLDEPAPDWSVRLYHVVGDVNYIVDVDKVDGDGDGLIDEVLWRVPHLSEQEYELEIIVLDVQSYPMVGGLWEVRFKTLGDADLAITAVDGTTWSPSGQGTDLKLMNITCDGADRPYEFIDQTAYIPGFSCNGTCREISRVQTEGKHHLQFDFGGQKQTAHNLAGWWNASWFNRQRVDFTVGSGVTPGDFQVRLDLNSSIVGANWNWTAECATYETSRIRFVNGSGDHELDFWVESCNATNQTMIVWVEVDQNITTANYTTYLYYGNPQATPKSDGTETFDFFEDFSGDLSKWSSHKTSGVYPRIENGYLVCGGGTTSSPYGHTALGSAATYSGFSEGIVEGNAYFTSNSIGEVGFRGNYAGNTGYKSRMDARSGQGISHLKPPYNGWGFLGGCTGSGTAVATGAWTGFNVTVIGSSFTIGVGGQTRTCSDTQYPSQGEISLQNHYGSYTRYDDIRVRKYADPGPVYYIGAEEARNYPPDTPLPSLASVDGKNLSSADINCSATVLDLDGDVMNVTVSWYNDDILNHTIGYNDSYANGTVFSALLGHGNLSVFDVWKCSMRLYDGLGYSGWGNSTDLTIIDTLPPTWANNKTSPASGSMYSQTAAYRFNVSWIDETQVDSVWIEHDFTGTLTNYSVSGNSNDVYYYDYPGLGAGSYTWRMHGNDTSDNLNHTPIWAYDVEKAIPPMALTAVPEWIINTGMETNVSCKTDNDQVNISLYRNQTYVASSVGGTVSDIQTLAEGTYGYTCNTTGGANYTGAYSENTLYITAKTISFCNLTLVPPTGQQYPVSLNATCICSNPESSAHMWRDGVDVTSENNTLVGLPAGAYFISGNVSPVWDKHILTHKKT